MCDGSSCKERTVCVSGLVARKLYIYIGCVCALLARNGARGVSDRHGADVHVSGVVAGNYTFM
jgi:hypothetical protein